MIVGIGPRALHMLGENSTSERNHQLWIFKDRLIYYFMCLCVRLSVRMCNTSTQVIGKSAKKVPASLALKLQAAVNHVTWVPGTEPGSAEGAVSAQNYWAIFPDSSSEPWL